MIQESDPRVREALIARLEQAKQIALSDSDAAESQFAVGEEHAAWQTQRDFVSAAIDEAIAILRERP